MHNRLTGISGEKAAGELLTRSGYHIIEKNFRTKFGEIDLIAIKDGVLVFIEVKTRNNKKFGLPEEAVNRNKLNKIARVGDLYSLLNPQLPRKKRIDVVSLEFREGITVSSKIIQVS